MILINWPSGVNKNFFGMTSHPLSNTETTSYISGRVVSWQRNTKKLMSYSLKLLLDVNTEIPLFWSWFNDSLGQTAGAFTCDAIGTSAYRFTEVPSLEDTDQNKTILNLTIEEV